MNRHTRYLSTATERRQSSGMTFWTYIRSMDWILVAATLGLVVFGFIMLNSATQSSPNNLTAGLVSDQAGVRSGHRVGGHVRAECVQVSMVRSLADVHLRHQLVLARSDPAHRGRSVGELDPVA